MVSVPDVGRRTYLALMAAVVGAGVLAWATAVLVMHESLGFAAVWLLITTGVLLPSAAPMVATFTALRRAVAGTPRACSGTAAFVTGYAAAWAAAGSVVWVLAAIAGAVHSHAHADAIVFALAAAYQLTPLKDRFLAQCRVPLSFLMSSWRDGLGGAFDMGARYGGYCIGASAVLVATMFAHGWAELWSMALVAVLIAVEKLSPSRFVARRCVAGVLLALAVAALALPSALPWI